MTTLHGRAGHPGLSGSPDSPADAHSQIAAEKVRGSLSPSRAADFMTCPLLYRFRTIDRLPEPLSPSATRGTVVHRVLENLYDHPAAERTPQTVEQMVEPAWREVLADDPELSALFVGEGAEQERWMKSVHSVLQKYFDLEDPTRLEPADRELYVEWLADSGLLLRGFIDRVDVAPNGMVRVVDYKTGRSPGPGFEARALFQMKFYALVLWRLRGVVPAMLQLVYLGNGEVLRHEPDEEDLLATERKLHAIWQAIEYAERTGDWRPRRSRLCDWCAHQSLCPEFGGTPPPLPQREGVEIDTRQGVDENPA